MNMTSIKARNASVSAEEIRVSYKNAPSDIKNKENSEFHIDAENEIECKKFKIGSSGEILGYIDDCWRELDFDTKGRKGASNEILVSTCGGLTKIGVDIIKSYGRRMGVPRSEPYAVRGDGAFEKKPNSLALIPNKIVKLSDGTILEWTKNTVIAKPRDGSPEAENYARKIAVIMDDFTRVANKQILGLGRYTGISKTMTKEIDKVLRSMGVDTSKDFYVNGKKFNFNPDSGEYEYKLESTVDGKYKVVEVDNRLKYKGKLIKMAYL